jgi:hypothetical protein
MILFFILCVYLIVYVYVLLRFNKQYLNLIIDYFIVVDVFIYVHQQLIYYYYYYMVFLFLQDQDEQNSFLLDQEYYYYYC